jgi:peptidoglycan/LPS O-acetylase OafA/YrhL
VSVSESAAEFPVEHASARGYIPALDGIRGIAILLVLVHQYNVVTDRGPGWRGAVDLGLEVGWVGVQLFFVLSGFLITGILLDTKGRPDYYRGFYLRRVLRIFPLYYAALVAGLVVYPIVAGHALEGHQHQAWLWLYVSNWFAPFGRAVYGYGPFWSLAVEEQFYVVWPFVVAALSTKGLLRLCVAIAILGPIARSLSLRAGLPHDAVYQLTYCRIDALAIGAGALLLMREPSAARWIRRRRRSLVLASMLTLAAGAAITHAFSRLSWRTETLGFSILAWVFARGIVVAVDSDSRGGRTARFLSWAPLRALGRVSYGMYVFHAALYLGLGHPLLERWVPRRHGVFDAIVFDVIMIALTFAIANVSYYLFERPFLRLKDKLAPRQITAARTA